MNSFEKGNRSKQQTFLKLILSVYIYKIEGVHELNNVKKTIT